MYEEAAKIAEDIYGPTDKRTLDYRTRAEELARTVPPKKLEKERESAESAGKGSRITKESVLATTYGTFNGTRMKLIIVDYIKGKSLKVYGMRKDGTFAKSLCLPYTVFQIYFQVEGKTVTPADIKNEEAIEWYEADTELAV